MKYFIDTEFIEGFHKPIFGKKRHFIDLISIGIIAEDGREYYAISNEFNQKDADKWVKENVIAKLPAKYQDRGIDGVRPCYLYKSNSEIRQEMFDFITYGHHKDHKGDLVDSYGKPLEFYGYYADYDWVLFCSLFGRMIDLPNGWPMYCRDLKQMMDEFGPSKEWKKKNCPDPEGEHNALIDAKWNKRLHELISVERNKQQA